MKNIATLKKIVVGSIALVVVASAGAYGWYRLGDWQTRTLEDVAFLHETIRVHHPGGVDPENPEFATLMDQAHGRAMALAEAARSPTDHRDALRAYTDAFEDGHLRVNHLEDLRKYLAFGSTDRPQARAASGVSIEGHEAWITISSFSERSSSIASVTQEIEAQADELRAFDRIVFDLRGNTGGNSAFATRISRALWTDEVFEDWVPVSAAAVEWRASAENALHVHGIAQSNEERGRPQSAASWTRMAERLDAAVDAGEDYVRQELVAREVTRTLESPVTAEVIVITDGACASACLDFMDQLRALPGVLHVGEETSSDTQYIDVRGVNLPSGFGRLVIPLKVYRERVRPSGGTYAPEVRIDTDALDAATLRATIAEARPNPEAEPAAF